MKLERILYIVRHPVIVWEQHRVKEIVRLKRGGKEPENIYYVIRLDIPECGLFAIFMYVLDHLAYAEDNGYIPILSSEKYESLYKEDHAVYGTKDPWRYYFEPVTDITPREAWKFKNVIYGKIRFPRYKGIYYYKEKNVLPSKNQIRELNALVAKYIKFRPELQELLEKELEKFKGRRLVGVHIRGTDMYRAGKQHPLPTGKQKDFAIIDEILERHKLDGIFLASDTESTVELFQNHYGDKVIVSEAIRQKDDEGTGIHKDKMLGKNRMNHKYLMGREAIIDMYLLAHCNVLVCGPSNVAFAAMIYNNNAYEEIIYCV